MWIAAIACSVFVGSSKAWYNQYEAGYGNGWQSDYVSVPSTGNVSIVGSGAFGWNDYALLQINAPTETINCYCYQGWEERAVYVGGLLSGTYQVQFVHDIADTSGWIHYSVSIDW